jgi:cell division protein FtsB
MDNALVVVGLLASGGVLTAIVNALIGRRRASAETTDLITQAAERAVGLIQQDNVRLRAEVERLTARVEELSAEIHALKLQIGITATPPPKGTE